MLQWCKIMLWLHHALGHGTKHATVWGPETSTSLYVFNNTATSTPHLYSGWKLPNQCRHWPVGGPHIRHWSRQWCWPTNFGHGKQTSPGHAWEVGYVVCFKLALSGTKVSLVGYSFVNDMDLIQTGPSLTFSGTDILPLMQATLTLWEQGLQAIGGTLVPDKPIWYLLDFKWKCRQWQYIKYTMDPGQLLMKDHKRKNQSANYWLPILNTPWGVPATRWQYENTMPNTPQQNKHMGR